MRRAMGVVKMRGSKHDPQLREFMVDTGGIKLSDSFEGYEGIMSGNPRKLTMMDEAVERFSQPFASKRMKA
jgi:hypothetical protein